MEHLIEKWNHDHPNDTFVRDATIRYDGSVCYWKRGCRFIISASDPLIVTCNVGPNAGIMQAHIESECDALLDYAPAIFFEYCVLCNQPPKDCAALTLSYATISLPPDVDVDTMIQQQNKWMGLYLYARRQWKCEDIVWRGVCSLQHVKLKNNVMALIGLVMPFHWEFDVITGHVTERENVYTAINDAIDAVRLAASRYVHNFDPMFCESPVDAFVHTRLRRARIPVNVWVNRILQVQSALGPPSRETHMQLAMLAVVQTHFQGNSKRVMDSRRPYNPVQLVNVLLEMLAAAAHVPNNDEQFMWEHVLSAVPETSRGMQAFESNYLRPWFNKIDSTWEANGVLKPLFGTIGDFHLFMIGSLEGALRLRAAAGQRQ